MTNNVPGDAGLRRPFPAPSTRPDNPQTPERVALGRLLYFDPVLSGANDQSCATCHHPDLGLTDGRGLSMGRGGKGLGPERDGGRRPAARRADGLERGLQPPPVLGRPCERPRRPGAESRSRLPTRWPRIRRSCVNELRAIPEYVRLFDEAFGGKDGSAVTFENVTRAIAAFERTLTQHALALRPLPRGRRDRARRPRSAAASPSSAR